MQGDLSLTKWSPQYLPLLLWGKTLDSSGGNVGRKKEKKISPRVSCKNAITKIESRMKGKHKKRKQAMRDNIRSHFGFLEAECGWADGCSFVSLEETIRCKYAWPSSEGQAEEERLCPAASGLVASFLLWAVAPPAEVYSFSL